MDMDKYNPNACPKCGSEAFDIVDRSADSTNIWQYLACDCGESWTEEYTLTSVWTADEEDN
jgi:ribosomal protein L37AE/L43A